MWALKSYKKLEIQEDREMPYPITLFMHSSKQPDDSNSFLYCVRCSWESRRFKCSLFAFHPQALRQQQFNSFPKNSLMRAFL